jgi:quinol monooxygenase YgiN
MAHGSQAKPALDWKLLLVANARMIHVIAVIEIVEGKRAAFLEEFHRLMPKVHAETGCIEYGPTVDITTDIPVQTPLRPNVVTIVEKWSNLDALKSHLKAPHMGEYRERVKGLVKSVQLQVLEPA